MRRAVFALPSGTVEPGEPLAALPPALSSLRHRNYRWLWSGTFFSTAAQWIQNATLGWVVYDLTGSAVLLGAVLGVRAIPMLLLAPVSGLVADRFDRRKALAVSQVLPAIASLLLAALLALGAVQVWHLFLFSLLVSTGTVFERTLRNTLVFDVVPRADAANAIALNTIAFSVTRTLGPAFAGILIALLGPAWNFAIQGMTYAGVAASVLMIRVAPRASTPAASRGWHTMFAGFRFAATDPVARVIVIIGLVPPLLLIPSFSALMPIFAADIFRAGPEGLGLLLSAVGAGGVVGGVVAATLSRYEHVARLQSIAMGGFVLCLVGFGFSPTMWVATVFLVGAGIAEMVLASSTHTSLQMSAPESMRGQVTSLLPMFPAFISLGSFAAGLGAQALGAPAIVVSFALVAAVVTTVAWTRSAAYRGLRLSTLVAGRR
jgi:MFS family permease